MPGSFCSAMWKAPDSFVSSQVSQFLFMGYFKVLKKAKTENRTLLLEAASTTAARAEWFHGTVRNVIFSSKFDILTL